MGTVTTSDALRTWKHLQHYADAKSDVVREILSRAAASRRGQ